MLFWEAPTPLTSVGVSYRRAPHDSSVRPRGLDNARRWERGDYNVRIIYAFNMNIYATEFPA